MARSSVPGVAIRGIATCVPDRVFDNVKDTTAFPPAEVRKVVAMAGVAQRREVYEAAERAGADFVFDKPIDLDELRNVVSWLASGND
jgi:hypothetical protein